MINQKDDKNSMVNDKSSRGQKAIQMRLAGEPLGKIVLKTKICRSELYRVFGQSKIKGLKTSKRIRKDEEIIKKVLEMNRKGRNRELIAITLGISVTTLYKILLDNGKHKATRFCPKKKRASLEKKNISL